MDRDSVITAEMQGDMKLVVPLPIQMEANSKEA